MGGALAFNEIFMICCTFHVAVDNNVWPIIITHLKESSNSYLVLL